jgi:hypothetical protein
MLTGQRTLQSRVPEAVGWSMLSPLHARAARGCRVNTVTIPAASAKESNAKMAAFFNSQSSTPLNAGPPPATSAATSARLGQRIKSEARQTA